MGEIDHIHLIRQSVHQITDRHRVSTIKCNLFLTVIVHQLLEPRQQSARMSVSTQHRNVLILCPEHAVSDHHIAAAITLKSGSVKVLDIRIADHHVINVDAMESVMR